MKRPWKSFAKPTSPCVRHQCTSEWRKSWSESSTRDASPNAKRNHLNVVVDRLFFSVAAEVKKGEEFFNSIYFLHAYEKAREEFVHPSPIPTTLLRTSNSGQQSQPNPENQPCRSQARWGWKYARRVDCDQQITRSDTSWTLARTTTRRTWIRMCRWTWTTSS